MFKTPGLKHKLYLYFLPIYSLLQVHNQVIETYNGYNCIVLTSEELIKGHFVDS